MALHQCKNVPLSFDAHKIFAFTKQSMLPNR